MVATKENFEAEVLKSAEPVIVDFWAEWCGPCKIMEPVLDAFSKEKEIKLAKVDVDAQQELAAQYNVMAIPTILIFKNGNIANRVTGAVPRRTLETAISTL